MRWTSCLPLMLTLAASAACAQDDTVPRAMHDELSRSMQQLKLDAGAKPYFIAYRVDETQAAEVQATLGAISSSGESGYRRAQVDVRVGDANFDSSRVLRYPDQRSEVQVLGWSGIQLPLEDDYPALRRRFWLATDQAYKRAVEDLAVKRGVLASHVEPDRRPDHVPAEMTHIVDDLGRLKFDRARIHALARTLSGVFAEFPELEQSGVWLSLEQSTVYFENSEGSTSRRDIPEVVFGAVARARADDGMPIWDYDLATARSLDELPDAAVLTERMRDLARHVLEQRQAVRLGDDYTGPMLFSGAAAGNLFGDDFAAHLWPNPRYYSSEIDTQMATSGINAGRGAFERRIGSRVLPPGVSVSDEPLRERFGRAALLSAFRVDDEGVAASNKLLIQDGRLKQVLCTRAPASKQCTAGSDRGGATLGSSMVLTTTAPKKVQAMLADLRRLTGEAGLPYAIEIEKLVSSEALARLRTGSNMTWLGEGGQGQPVLRASLIYADGRRIPVRNLRLGEVDLRDFRGIVDIGDAPVLYSEPVGNAGYAAYVAGFGLEPRRVSFIVPALLFEELTAGDDRSVTVKPPLLKSPSAAP